MVTALKNALEYQRGLEGGRASACWFSLQWELVWCLHSTRMETVSTLSILWRRRASDTILSVKIIKKIFIRKNMLFNVFKLLPAVTVDTRTLRHWETEISRIVTNKYFTFCPARIVIWRTVQWLYGNTFHCTHRYWSVRAGWRVRSFTGRATACWFSLQWELASRPHSLRMETVSTLSVLWQWREGDIILFVKIIRKNIYMKKKIILSFSNCYQRNSGY